MYLEPRRFRQPFKFSQAAKKRWFNLNRLYCAPYSYGRRLFIFTFAFSIPMIQ
jgi:hypothetical protein